MTIETRKSHCRFSLMVAGALLAATAVRAQPGMQPNYQPVVPGLDYAHIQTSNAGSGEPLSIHIARMDRTSKDLQVAEMLAFNRVFDTAPVSAIAKQFPKERGEPLVAINAGFCIRHKDPYKGVPRGIKDEESSMVIVDGQMISSPSRYSFWVDEDGSMHFGRFESRLSAALPDGTSIPIGLNHECKPESVILFTHVLGESTRAKDCMEVILEDAQQKPLSWRVGESYVLRVKAVNPSGDTVLSNQIAVLSFGGKMTPKTGFKPGDSIKIELKTSPDLKNVVTACHAIFPLVENGKSLEKFDASGAILHKNPRTAIGFNDRYFYMVVVDGRQKTLSMGMKAGELAEFMLSLGCREAMNLDGGGSTTFWMQGKRRNSVPGGIERERSDALLIVRKSSAK